MDANHVSFSPTNPFLLRIRIHPQFILFFRSPSPTHSKSIPFGRYKPNRARYFQNAMTETGLSDFHNMEITFMKIFYEKQKLIATHYRRASIIFFCFFFFVVVFESMHRKIKNIFEKLIMTCLRKPKMTQTRLLNQFFKERSDESRTLHKRQRNIYMNLKKIEKSLLLQT